MQMKLSKCILLIKFLLMVTYSGFAQKQSFDVVSYSTPKGWQQQQNEGGVQLSVADKKTGGLKGYT